MSKSKTTYSEPFSMPWHIQCHENQRASLARKRESLNRLKSEVEKDEFDLQFYTTQINESAARGMKKFDSAKLLKRKRARR